MGLIEGKNITDERHESAPQFRKYCTPKKSAIKLRNPSQKPCFFRFISDQSDFTQNALSNDNSFESPFFSAPNTRRSLKTQESVLKSKHQGSRREAWGKGDGGLVRLNFEIKGSSVNIQQHPSTQQSQRSKQNIYKTTKNSSIVYPRDTTPAYCDKSISLYQNSVSCLSSSKEDNEREGLLVGKRFEREKLQSRLQTPTTSSKVN